MIRDLCFFLPCLLATFLFVPPLLQRGAAKPPPVVAQESAKSAPALWLALSARSTFRSDVRAEDSFYVCPTTAQVPELIKFCEKARTKKYVPDAWDCDDLAREYRVNAAKWSVGVWPGVPAALAVGTAIVRLDGVVHELGIPSAKGLHAMIVLCRADGVWILIEPTTAKWVKAEEAFYEGNVEFLSIAL